MLSGLLQESMPIYSVNLFQVKTASKQNPLTTLVANSARFPVVASPEGGRQPQEEKSERIPQGAP